MQELQVEVSRNTIRDHAFVGSGQTQPFGILADDGLTSEQQAVGASQADPIRRNVLRSNQISPEVVLRGDGSSIVDNTFDGTAPGLRPAGLALSGENVPVALNRFSNMPKGIVLLGNDPEFGTYLGIAHNAQLNTNRFCNVTTDRHHRDHQPPPSKQGTLPCPGAPPTLAIAPQISSSPGRAKSPAGPSNPPPAWAVLGLPPTPHPSRSMDATASPCRPTARIGSSACVRRDTPRPKDVTVVRVWMSRSKRDLHIAPLGAQTVSQFWLSAVVSQLLWRV